MPAYDVSQGLNTTGTLIGICQNDLFQFSFLQNTYLGLAQAITSIIRCAHASLASAADWYLRQHVWVLVHPETLENQHEEDGGASLVPSPRARHAAGANFVSVRQFVVTNVATILIPLWGMVGIWTNKLGCVGAHGVRQGVWMINV